MYLSLSLSLSPPFPPSIEKTLESSYRSNIYVSAYVWQKLNDVSLAMCIIIVGDLGHGTVRIFCLEIHDD